MLQLAANETPTPATDGVLTTFALAHSPVDVAHLWARLAGAQVQVTLSGNTITFPVGIVPQPGDPFVVDYWWDTTGAASSATPSPPPASALQLAANEAPTPLPNGVRTTFALAHVPIDATHVWARLNGVQVVVTVSGVNITLPAGIVPQTGDSLLVDYWWTPASGTLTIGGLVTLLSLRTQVRFRSDMTNSQFVTDAELNGYINASYAELYDLLVQKFGDDYFVADPYSFTTDGSTERYPLPSDFYKLVGVDLQLDAAHFTAVQPFTMYERNAAGATVPQGGQTLRLWYTPRPTFLVNDLDVVDGISGWEEYVVVDAAIKCKDKEESDTSVLLAAKQGLIQRIESASENRDSGYAQTVTDVRSGRRGSSLRYRVSGSYLWLRQSDGFSRGRDFDF